jgi:hypothetical protein
MRKHVTIRSKAYPSIGKISEMKEWKSFVFGERKCAEGKPLKAHHPQKESLYLKRAPL